MSIREFIELLIDNNNRQEPFLKVIYDMDLYDVIWQTEEALARELGIPEDILAYTIRDYVHGIAVYDENDNLITSVDELTAFVEEYAHPREHK